VVRCAVRALSAHLSMEIASGKQAGIERLHEPRNIRECIGDDALIENPN
jgi:hypothetical protein